MNKQKDKQFISDLKPGQGVSSPFLAKDKQLMGYANRPGQFLQTTLADRTGEIKAVMWDRAEDVFSTFEDGDVVWVEGQIKTYRGSPQVTIHDIRSCEAGSYNLEDFLPRTNKDTEFLLQKLRDEAASIKNPFLWMLLESFLDDPEFVTAFLAAPAAKSIHHAYLGGLIEHTANVVEIVTHMAQLYPALDRELLIAGAILHDIGKVQEYRFDGLLDVTDEGRLLGHIVIGDRMLSERIKGIDDFPRELEMRLRHLVISHHGAYEYGSPRRPKFAEACVLHYADNMDAHTARFVQIQEANKNRAAHWSPYDSVLERYIYLGQKDEESKDEIAAAEIGPQPES